MGYVLSISVLVWYNLHLSQAAAGAGRKEPVGDAYFAYPSRGLQEEAICKGALSEAVRCAMDLLPLTYNGFPWALADLGEMQDHIRNLQKQSGNFGDPLDPINHVCEVFGDFLRCLDEHAIPSECLLNGHGGLFRAYTVYNFICYIQPSSTDFLHSLQCLKGSRVLDLLVLYLADRSDTRVDDMAQGTVNALFRFLNSVELNKYNINPLILNSVVSQGLICLPESVISHDVTFIVDRKCGSHAADLVRDFYLYHRTRFNGALRKMGLPTNICDKETRSHPTTDRVYTAPDDAQTDRTFSKLFDQFLEENSPGTAMDTAFGHSLRNAINNTPVRKFCDPLTRVDLSFEACSLLSYHPSGKARFNILQYAHSVNVAYFTPFPDSSSLTIFRSC